MKEDRKEVLLRAAYDLLKRAEESSYVLYAPEIVVKYDNANCDGGCLMEDIAMELGFDTDEHPIPLDEEEKT